MKRKKNYAEFEGLEILLMNKGKIKQQKVNGE